MARHAQLYQGMYRLTKGECSWSSGGMTTLEIVENERLIEF